MSPFSAPAITEPCPVCGCKDEMALNWAFPDPKPGKSNWEDVQIACLACGTHGHPFTSYDDALKDWSSSEFKAEQE